MTEREASCRALGSALVLAASLVAACGSPSPTAPRTPPIGTPPAQPLPGPSPTPDPVRVVILSIDGLRPDAISSSTTPHIAALIARGAYTFAGQTVTPSLTLPSHASMLSGFLPSAHGITWGDYEPVRGTIAVPTVMAVARAAGLRTVMVAGKDKFTHLRSPGSCDVFVVAADDAAVAAEAIGQAGSAFRLMFVHLPDADRVGHVLGWMTSPYLRQVAEADDQAGAILAALPENTTVIVTADHGGEGRDHNAGSRLDLTIPWVIAGPRVAARRSLPRVSTTDTAATAAWLLDLRLPPGAVGRPVYEAFVPPASSPGAIRP